MDQATVQTKRICDEIKNGLKEMNLPRYKYVVQVVIGEQRGEGVRMGSRCFWDSETDNVASETYVNVRVVRPPTYLTTSVCMGCGAVERTYILLSLHPAFQAICASHGIIEFPPKCFASCTKDRLIISV
ncbi:conserved unknown protein [Ectocarpus siliculosus]|uniref:Uncharacterized protein n=1 Tax=Ectocarpus siliculosus TaxID=2880 RepID=D7FHW5_ECTSI|nr:conserved unknown protein [Ectocarpus siliculosus]|eukprot:CBJ48976.1 conserved unknown protein [Ectocarpus siliculosus]